MIRLLISFLLLSTLVASLHAEECECTRAVLKAATDSYVEAQKTGKLSKMNLADKVKYIENMSVTTKDKGMWNTALPIALHRSFFDVPRGKTFTEIIVTEGENKYVIGTRLKVKNCKIVEIDSLVTKKGDWLFNADDYLKYSSAEDWRMLTPDERVSRQDLIDAGNQYFDFVFLDKGIRPPWGSPCARLEGGAYTNAKNEDKDTCQIPGPLGEIYIINRSFVVDEEMGVVNVFCRFVDPANGLPDSHTFRLVNGRYRFIHTLNPNISGKPIEVPDYKPE